MSTAGEVLYEVTLDVDAGIEAEYRAWLRDHVAQMLALPGLTSTRSSSSRAARPAAPTAAVARATWADDRTKTPIS